MSDDAIAGPVDKLLTLGEPIYSRQFDWPDYSQLGNTHEHVPVLIPIATNQSLLCLSDESDPGGRVPVHAWRALGQLRATAAIAPLMQLMHEVKDNDWVMEEMPDVFGLIGLEAFRPLADYFSDPSYPVYSRLIAATGIVQIALDHSEVRLQCIELLAAQLANYEQNRPCMNSVLIAQLVELDAVEKADLVHKVFAAGKVDRFIVGDWRVISSTAWPIPVRAESYPRGKPDQPGKR